jgi:anti-sigma B factor antagonist
MQIEQREVGSVVVLDLSGRFVLEDGVDPFLEMVNALIRSGRNRIVLNFEGVTYLDSAAVGAIAGKYVTAQRRGGDIKLLQLRPRAFTVLETTRLLSVISSYDSEDTAVASFVSDSAKDDVDPIFT